MRCADCKFVFGKAADRCVKHPSDCKRYTPVDPVVRVPPEVAADLLPFFVETIDVILAHYDDEGGFTVTGMLGEPLQAMLVCKALLVPENLKLAMQKGNLK